MSNGILQSAISGVNANAQSVAAAADNIANVSTPGYKSTNISHSTLNTQQNTASYSAGGVQVSSRPLADVQGLLASSTRSTDLAIAGDGYFPVSSQPQGGEVLFTRGGSFAPDSQGNLVNAGGYFLQARQPGSAKGDLSAVNVNTISGTAQATTNITVSGNLPAHGPAGSDTGKNHTISAQATDSLGNTHAVALNFEAQAGGGYQLTIPGAQQGDSTGPDYSVGVVASSSGQTSGFDNNGDGTIDSSAPPGVYIAYSASGAADQTIQVDLSSLTQLSGDFTVGAVQSDGAAYGQVSGVSVSGDGLVSASFDNGTTRAIADIAVATFSSPQNLQAVGGNAFRATDGSGSAAFDAAGAGSVQGYALEQSNTDLGTEFASLFVAQSAYSATLKVLSTGDEMSKSLLSVRG